MTAATLDDSGIAPNAKRLLWAGFTAILAAGVGFAIRNGTLATWSQQFGFTNLQNGLIGGAGFSGFCFGIIIGGVIVDKIGYGKLIISAFLLHVLSAIVTLMPTSEMGQQSAFLLLFSGTFIFSLANGTLEAVANPLVATLFPKNRTHYLNILHASWPAGMIIGALITLAVGNHWSWKAQLGLYLLPTVVYGLMFFGQSFPKSDASAKGLSLGEMMKEVGILGASVAGFLLYLFTRDALGANILAGLTQSDFFVSGAWNGLSMLVGIGFVAWVAVITRGAIGHWLLFVLFLTHAVLGSLELGTDSWIENINGTILTPSEGKILFIFASAMMFGLRFCSHWIENKLKLSPIALLFVCSIFAIVGLFSAAGVNGITAAFGAMFIYSIGKTFFWPTMLAVVGDRFPRTGAVAMSIMGGIGMLSVGQLGGPGLGYAKDRFTAEHMVATGHSEVLESHRSEKPSKWLGFSEVTALDGKALEEAKKLAESERSAGQQAMVESEIAGSRKTLRFDAILPIGMATVYLLLLLYFKSIGGYKVLTITPEEASGGSQGPAGY
ncbi:MFS family permease [Haloferula luteola]|uniref:MFS family permease n=1 Tax=Haloferula luteola TaxID=595692 RepID=A0A840V897_9BACT|nr:MFS transporter [Haloferula luteola]MBB5349999.1 MFS family permease [Haloferula luteola]